MLRVTTPSLRHVGRYREIAALVLRYLRQAGLDVPDDLAELGDAKAPAAAAMRPF